MLFPLVPLGARIVGSAVPLGIVLQPRLARGTEAPGKRLCIAEPSEEMDQHGGQQNQVNEREAAPGFHNGSEYREKEPENQYECSDLNAWRPFVLNRMSSFVRLPGIRPPGRGGRCLLAARKGMYLQAAAHCL